ncbi:NYN domain-containing protein [Congregibacter sp.]|uniref:NYN domain-containing protein n=1 Tax=Congregibacter sp. TaxID=2744308 RepID=UPI003F6D69B0
MSLLARVTAFLRASSAPAEAHPGEPGAEESPGASALFAGRHFVLDGTNIALLHGPRHPELRYVLAIAQHLGKNGGSFTCFFDANTSYLFRDGRPEQLACFEQLISEQPWAEHFRVVPSGTQADPWILEHAKEEGADVISNDRFKDRAKAHRWIWKRRHSLEVVDRKLCLPTLETSLELLALPEDYLHTDNLVKGP